MSNAILPLDPQLQARLEKFGARWAQDEWATMPDIPGHGQFPLLVLPREAMAFHSELGFFPSLKTFTRDNQKVVVGEICSFSLKEGQGEWAIPMKYTPQGEGESLRQILGFDENWEKGAPGPMFLIVCNDPWKNLFRLALSQDRMGISVTGGESIYPMSLSPYARKALEAAIVQK